MVHHCSRMVGTLARMVLALAVLVAMSARVQAQMGNGFFPSTSGGQTNNFGSSSSSSFGTGSSTGAGSPSTGFGTPSTGFGGSQNSMGAPPTGFGTPPTGLGTPPTGFGMPSSNFGASTGYPSAPNPYGPPAGFPYPNNGYGPAVIGNPGTTYPNPQSITSLRAAACVRDPHFCSSAALNGYIGPNQNGSLPTPMGTNTTPVSVPPGFGSTLGAAYGASPYGAFYYGMQMPPNYSMPGSSLPGYGMPGSFGAPSGYGPSGYGMSGSYPPTGGYGTTPGYGGMGMPGSTTPTMGYASPVPQTSSANANPYNSGMPTLGGPAPANGFPSGGGFPSSGTLGQSPSSFGGGSLSSLLGAASSVGMSSGMSSSGSSSGSSFFGASSGLGNLSTLAGGLDQNTLNTVAAQLGVSGTDLNNLRNQVANGSLSPEQLQSLTGRFAALNLSGGQMSAITTALGLNPGQVGQIQQSLTSMKGPPYGTTGQQYPGLSSNGMPFGYNGMTPGSIGQSPFGLPTPPSPIEAKFQEVDNPYDVPQPPSTENLAQFGYNFFYAANPNNPMAATFAPTQNIPVGNDYVIGPGDEIDILLWGRVNTVLNPTVDRDGTIQVGELGPIHVAGLTFKEAKDLIEGKARKMTGVQVDVTTGQLRTINITVAGDVVQPGAYQISALSRVSNALVAAGGVSKVGSLRRVEVRHGNQLVDVLDLYDILLHGDSSGDRRLEEGDVIFVPVIGEVVGITGEVKRPAIYETLKGQTETLGDALSLSGGVTGFGYTGHLQVERVQNHRRLVALDVPVSKLSRQNFVIRDGDVIRVFPVMPGEGNSVTLAGNVRRSGKFQWFRGMRVSDLVRKGDGVLPNTSFKYALIRRVSGGERQVHFYQVNLGDALTNPRMSPGDLAMQPNDELDIYNLDDIRDLPAVAVNGEVRMPGSFVLSPDMKVSDLVYMAGGLKNDAYQERAVLVRTEVVPGGKAVRRHYDVNLHAILDGDYSVDLRLRANDELFVRNIMEWQRPPEFVEVSGEVRMAGIYDYYPGMTVGDLVAIAGGPMDDAYLKRAELARTEVVNGSVARHTYMDIDLRQQAKGLADRTTLLKPNDVLLIKAASNYHLPFTVLVAGKVMRPGVYTIREGERLHSLLERCGGFLPDAFVPGIVFRRVSVQKMEQDGLNDARDRLMKQAANLAMTQAQWASLDTSGSSSSSTTGAAGAASMVLLQNVLSSSVQQAEGRMVVHVESTLDGKSSADDVVLEDGDEVDVPVIPSSVIVMGEVNHPSSFLRIRSNTVRDYINQAGGFTQYAAKKQVIVIKADGSVLTSEGYEQSRRSSLFPALPLISGGLMDARVDVGDMIFVPDDLTRFQDIQMTKDITTIIANAAQSLAVVGLLATQL